MSPILNYTTEVPAAKTAAEIQEILRQHGATAVTLEYAGGKTIGLTFEVGINGRTIPFRLPVKPEPIVKILMTRYKRDTWDSQLQRAREQKAAEQAERTAWRIVKDWIEAQMALLDVEMVRMEQVFLPYAISPSGKTFYEVLQDRHFLLGPGNTDEE